MSQPSVEDPWLAMLREASSLLRQNQCMIDAIEEMREQVRLCLYRPWNWLKALRLMQDIAELVDLIEKNAERVDVLHANVEEGMRAHGAFD
jgi:hypothetical protein